MFPNLFLSAALALGQTGGLSDAPGVATVTSPPPATVTVTSQGELVPNWQPPAPLLAMPAAPMPTEPILSTPPAEPVLSSPVLATPTSQAKDEPKPRAVNVEATQEPAKSVDVTAPVLPPKKPAEEAAAPAAAAASGDRWLLMRELQGTWLGSALDDHRTSISGWLSMSFTASTNDRTNVPMVWNDRANKFLFQQGWIRLERSVVTEGTTDPTFGYRVDVLTGSDYRFSLPRGLWNSQLLNGAIAADPQDLQNLYGVDLIQFYGNIYIPTLFQGTDIRFGRLYTPFGYESLEAVSTPLVSRSYAFNWCPPFTHMGIQASTTFSKEWSAVVMLANGNDVFIDDAQEMRVVGNVKYTHPNQKDVFTLGYTVGRGKFNSGNPFAPQTASLMSEDAGRNNINVFDFVWNHTFNPRTSYGFEIIYGYQTNVPSTAAGGPAVGAIIRDNALSGTAHWGSIVNYLNHTFTEKLTGVLRVETFNDFQGQRTGFEGLYTAVTAGVQYKPYAGLIFRPEIRYDHNGYSRPFDGKHDLFTAAMDMIVRY